jgi:hypothetical protein
MSLCHAAMGSNLVDSVVLVLRGGWVSKAMMARGCWCGMVEGMRLVNNNNNNNNSLICMICMQVGHTWPKTK